MKPAILFLICIIIPGIHCLAFGLSGCCAIACGAEAAAVTSATGGIALPLEIAHVGLCVGECIATGGFIVTLMTAGVPVPVCTWSIFLPF